jgi:hypothetical protein
MMAASSSETLVPMYHNERCHNAKGSKRHSHRHENLKSYTKERWCVNVSVIKSHIESINLLNPPAKYMYHLL